MPVLGIIASQMSGHLVAPTSYESIATFTGSASSVTFSSIPGTYTHLQLRMMAVGTDDPTIKVNTSFATKGHHLAGIGTTVDVAYLYPNYLDYAVGLSITYPTVGVLDFLDYADVNKNKTLRYLYGIDRNGSGEVLIGSKFWNSTAAITSITITSTINDSSFALYGIKGA